MFGFLRLKYNFVLDFFIKRTAFPCYDEAHNKTNNNEFSFKTAKKFTLEDKVFVVNLIPPYIDLKTNETGYSFYKLSYIDGFLINLKDYPNIDSYLENQFGAKSRSKLRLYRRRLETCFDIKYEMHYGHISKERYTFLMDHLKSMIKRRFAQRNETHEALKDWNVLKDISFQKIKEREAALFVIYDGSKPIDICLNFLHQNIFNNTIRSYDIDYYRFRLGHVDILKQLEWCVENGFTIFDLSYGDLDYKRKWCNTIYQFENHILFPKNSIRKRLMANCIILLLKTKNFLKEKKVHVLIRRLKSIGKNKINLADNVSTTSFLKNTSEDISNIRSKGMSLDISSEKYAHLRKEVYDFQYRNSEHSKNINVYKHHKDFEMYTIFGETSSITITSQKNT